MNMEAASAIIFKRILEGGKILVRTECSPGHVTVLQDENGADLPGYEAFFYGKQTKERITIEVNQSPLDISQVLLIGFSDNLPSGVSISEYLCSQGYQQEELAKIFVDYELEKVHYLPCAHLPQVPQRIVLLLAALRSSYKAIIMKDPFMPFSGRWREQFAALVLKASQDKNQVIVCTNLSFVPQTWAKGDVMQYLDVGHAAEEARSLYKWEQEKKEREQALEKQAKKSEVAPSPSSSSTIKPSNTIEPNTEETSDIPESIGRFYRDFQDRFFYPLKEISNFLRSYSLMVGVSGMIFLIVSMGVVFSPNLSELQAKIRTLAARSDLSFANVVSALRASTTQKPIEVSVDEVSSDSIQTLEYPETELEANPQDVDGSTPKEEWMIELDDTSIASLLFLLEHGNFEQNSCNYPEQIPQEEAVFKDSN
jgi:hypothetical protein